MTEKQNVEYKLSWRDEYLKWVCGFANAQGGRLIVGANDEGNIEGLNDAAKLLEDIPNKIKDILGIMADVNLQSENGKEYLEITVEPYPYPISYKGQYHYRSGSTKQELKGAALDRFLLQKQGKRWDGMPLPRVSVTDLSDQAFSHFKKKSIKAQRLPNEIIKDSNGILLEKLKLVEGSYLKRAALLLFHPDPEIFVTGAYIKIGFFRTDDDLLYQDTIHGTLFEQVDKTMDLLLTKYTKALISYEGIYRVEKYPFPEDALREALLNAVVHKDYSCGNPIQVSVYEDRIYIWNEGQLPDNWTVEKLLRKHPSIPYNPDIANTFFRAGYIESWGRGMLKIIKECKRADILEPVFKYDFHGLMVEFKTKQALMPESNVMEEQAVYYGERRENVGEASVKRRGNVGETSVKILALIRATPYITIPELASAIGITERSVERNIQKLKEEKLLRRIGADKGGSWAIVE